LDQISRNELVGSYVFDHRIAINLGAGYKSRIVEVGEMRNTGMGHSYYRLIDRWLIPLAEWAGLTPNQTTVLGLAAAILVPAGYLLHPLAGAGLILASGLADSMDGLLARSRQQSSAYGAFLDSCMDRISDGFYLMGIWVLFWPDHYPLAGGLVMAACLTATFLVSYTKARAESLGAAMDGGLMERAARIVYLLVWSLALAALPSAGGTLLWAGALVYLGLTAVTVGRRMLRARDLLEPGGKPPAEEANPEGATRRSAGIR